MPNLKLIIRSVDYGKLELKKLNNYYSKLAQKEYNIWQ